MKQILFVLIFLTSFNLFSQTENITSIEITKKLCKNWKLKEMKSEGEIMPFNLHLEIKYFENNTFEMNANGGIEKGKWNVEKINNEYYIVINKSESTKLVSVDENSFVISKSFENNRKESEKMSVEYYFILND